MVRKAVITTCALVLVGLAVSRTRAQDTLLVELYGRGVHAYFGQEYEESHKFLTMAIDQGNKDPRGYYFRGLALLQLGRPDEAKTDFKAGADLEATSVGRAYDIGRSLQRVQGSHRLTLETHRQQARIDASKRERIRRKTRYELLRDAEDQVLRDPNRPSPPALALPDDGNAPPASPFDNQAKESAAVPMPKVDSAAPVPSKDVIDQPKVNPDPPADPADLGDDPFSDPGSDPFGDAGKTPPNLDAAQSPTPNVGSPKEGGTVGTIFRALTRAIAGDDEGGNDNGANAPGADPFGEGQPPKIDPFGDEPPADGGDALDPFGDGPPAKAPPANGGDAPDPFGDEPPANAPPANGGDAPDPFGDDPPAKAPPADPFGDDAPAAADPFADP